MASPAAPLANSAVAYTTFNSLRLGRTVQSVSRLLVPEHQQEWKVHGNYDSPSRWTGEFCLELISLVFNLLKVNTDYSCFFFWFCLWDYCFYFIQSTHRLFFVQICKRLCMFFLVLSMNFFFSIFKIYIGYSLFRYENVCSWLLVLSMIFFHNQWYSFAFLQDSANRASQFRIFSQPMCNYWRNRCSQVSLSTLLQLSKRLQVIYSLIILILNLRFTCWAPYWWWQR